MCNPIIVNSQKNKKTHEQGFIYPKVQNSKSGVSILRFLLDTLLYTLNCQKVRKRANQLNLGVTGLKRVLLLYSTKY